jgi:CBS domain containing-hemolysin-like protein
MTVISILLLVIALYLLTGFIFAIFFVVTGVSKTDEGAKGAGLGFRVIIVPGTMLFWPLLWGKWKRAIKN